MSTSPISKPATPASAGPDGKPEAPSSAATTETASHEDQEPKKRYTKGSRKLLQKSEAVFSRSAHSFARAIEEGLGTWREKRKASAQKKKDGALKDAVKNAGKAFTKFSKGIADIPEDVTKGLPKIKLFR